MKKCKDCYWLRWAIRKAAESPLAKTMGAYVHPCNRYPQNIYRAPNEPACGEFKKKEK